MLKRLQCSVNITHARTGKPQICVTRFIAVVWNHPAVSSRWVGLCCTEVRSRLESRLLSFDLGIPTLRSLARRCPGPEAIWPLAYANHVLTRVPLLLFVERDSEVGSVLCCRELIFSCGKYTKSQIMIRNALVREELKQRQVAILLLPQQTC